MTSSMPGPDSPNSSLRTAGLFLLSPNSACLSKVLPEDIIDNLNKDGPFKATLKDHIANGLNLPRSIMSSFDLSAPFRQGLPLVGRKEFWTSFGAVCSSSSGPRRLFKAVQDGIKASPHYPLMKDAGLEITTAGGINKREEAFMSSWAEKIPVLGRGVRASDRAYTGFLSKLRADTFSSLVDKAHEAGISFEVNPKAAQDLAKFINTATGRGSLGKYNNAGPLLNSVFFSPRLIASRVQMLNPSYYIHLDPFARKEALKSLLAMGAITSTVIGLAKAGGADVQLDPRSSDFAKIKVGNTRYDVLGGFQQYLRLGAQLATNQKITAKGELQDLGKKYGSDTRLDVGLKFLESKESPIASFVTDYLRGKNLVGEPFQMRTAVAQRFIPMVIQDMNDAYKDNGRQRRSRDVSDVVRCRCPDLRRKQEAGGEASGNLQIRELGVSSEY
jgi:hypothetical protein